MSLFKNRLRIFLRIAAIIAVVTLGVVFRNQIIVAIEQLALVGWPVLFIFPLFGIWNFAAACGWYGLVEATPRNSVPSRTRLFVIRLEAQAINIIAPLLSIGGEVLKTSLIAEKRGQITSAPSVILDTISSTIAGLVFSLLGTIYYFTYIQDEPRFLILILSSFLAVLMLFYWPLWLRLLRNIRIFPKDFIVRRVLDLLEGSSFHFYKPFRRAILWHLVERILMSVEILILSWSLGYTIGVTEALFAGAIMSAFSLLLFFIPAQIGAAEGGLALAFSILDLPANLGLTVALARRTRQMITTSVGLALLAFKERLGFTKPMSFVK
ncbi:MAG: lysylphosphatidylglycerol synthase domain-containing protein [Thermodesulfobacteriota bacterium]|nr:lysylphosphatidylglycerol synthase domain-containing protein [Thermodesulfobacteriota bacterium]